MGDFTFPVTYHMAQISDEGNIDEMGKFLVICQFFLPNISTHYSYCGTSQRYISILFIKFSQCQFVSVFLHHQKLL